MAKFKSNSIIRIAQQAGKGTPATTNFVSLPVLSDSSLAINGDDVDYNILRGSMTKCGFVPGEASYQFTLPLPIIGADGSVSLADPKIDLALKSCGFLLKTALRINTGGVTGTFSRGETVTSNNGDPGSATIIDVVGNVVWAHTETGTFAAADVITGGTSGATATISGTPIETNAYNLADTDAEVPYFTVRWYVDGLLFEAQDCRGAADFGFNVGELGRFNFVVQGLYVEPTDTALPAITDLDCTKPARAVNMSLKVGSYTPVGVSSLAINLNNSVNAINDMNGAQGLTGFLIQDRNPDASFNIDMDTISAYNPLNQWQTATLAQLSANYGPDKGAGYRWALIAPQIQKRRAGVSDDAMRMKWDITAQLTSSRDGEELWLLNY